MSAYITEFCTFFFKSTIKNSPATFDANYNPLYTFTTTPANFIIQDFSYIPKFSHKNSFVNHKSLRHF